MMPRRVKKTSFVDAPNSNIQFFNAFPIFLLAICLIAQMPVQCLSASYIIQMDPSFMPSPFANHDAWYHSIISSLSTTSDPSPELLYTYKNVLHGFSAVLSNMQLEQLQAMEGHLNAYPDVYVKIHTTHTPSFLGLDRDYGIWKEARSGDDIIIGIIDTGVRPENAMFHDKGMPEVPMRWKGTCEPMTMSFNSSTCNKKLIGARSFSKGIKSHGINVPTEYDSPRDFHGHGTHTSSTAAGSPIHNVDYFGYAKGISSGMAPMARVAIYKVIFGFEDPVGVAIDVLAGMDQAIADGVDLMSLSIGLHNESGPYYLNTIAKGAFTAMERGIFVACSAGNNGPYLSSVSNGAPWITTVGAAIIDRDFRVSIRVHNTNISILGTSLYPEGLMIHDAPVYYDFTTDSSCNKGTLDPTIVSGKIVYCSYIPILSSRQQMMEVRRVGAKGGIFAGKTLRHLDARLFDRPFVLVRVEDGDIIKKDINLTSTINVSITFHLSTMLGVKPSPMVADFSSRGPYLPSPMILKPDIVAPRVNILAGWAFTNVIVTLSDNFPLFSDYNMISGTSMAAPHVIGLAALLRSLHRNWSPAAIRSAMMTTAEILDTDGNPITDAAGLTTATPLAIGAGHINPNKAANPGLVYDLEAEDYINFLCGLKYTTQQIMQATRGHACNCSRASLHLNYPSFMILLAPKGTTTQTFSRVLTNVDVASATYHAVVVVHDNMKVVVEPQNIFFQGQGSKQQFTITIEVDVEETRGQGNAGHVGYLIWSEHDGKYMVRSPISFVISPTLSSNGVLIQYQMCILVLVHVLIWILL